MVHDKLFLFAPRQSGLFYYSTSPLLTVLPLLAICPQAPIYRTALQSASTVTQSRVIVNIFWQIDLVSIFAFLPNLGNSRIISQKDLAYLLRRNQKNTSIATSRLTSCPLIKYHLKSTYLGQAVTSKWLSTWLPGGPKNITSRLLNQSQHVV